MLVFRGVERILVCTHYVYIHGTCNVHAVEVWGCHLPYDLILRDFEKTYFFRPSDSMIFVTYIGNMKQNYQ